MDHQPRTHQDRDPPESDSERRTTNMVMAVAAVLVIGSGVWLVNALVDSNKAQRCLEFGQRNCYPIAVPPREQD